jgi:predicted DNA-binding protein
VLPVRLPEAVDSRLKLIARAASITKSDALRLAVAHGLPSLESGQIHLAKGGDGV